MALATALLHPAGTSGIGEEPAGSTPAYLAEFRTRQELQALRARHALLASELDATKAGSRALSKRHGVLLESNERLETEVDALIVETTELNRELLDAALALAAAGRPADDPVRTRTAYNFVNVPIGGWVAPAESDVAAPTDAGSGIAVPIEAEPDVAVSIDAGSGAAVPAEDVIDAFYDDLDNGVPFDRLLDKLDRISASGLLQDEDLHMMYQELMYLDGGRSPGD